MQPVGRIQRDLGVTGLAGPAQAAPALLDWYDREHRISAMMRTTGFSLSLTAQLQAAGKTPKGVLTPDEATPFREYVDGLASHGVRITELEILNPAAEQPVASSQ